MLKSFPASYTSHKTDATDGLTDGQFRAVVSVFGNKDSYGEVVQPGAFTETLKDWAASGDPIPIYWSHQMADPDMNIGWVVDAKETDVGLEVVGQLDLGEGGSPKAKQAYRLLSGRRSTQFSFAYDVLDGGMVENDDDSFYELRRLKLHEVSPTPVGANPATELLAVKHAMAGAAAALVADVKAGRVLSSKNEATLRDALTSLEVSASQITSVLAALTTEDGKAGGADIGTATVRLAPIEADVAQDEEPPPATGAAKSEEPRLLPPVAVWATHLALLQLEGATS